MPNDNAPARKFIRHSSGLMIPQKVETQLELGLARTREGDRNLHLGGRSFYFFDFDDNVAFLATPLVLFHRETGAEHPISSGDYARHNQHIGKSGPFADYEIRLDDKTGTYRNFRDHDIEALEKLGRKTQIFLHDVADALGIHDYNWKGPSWSCFYHATFNQRPVSVITARGHSPSTVRDGIQLLVDSGHLPQLPNFLSIFPVSNPTIRYELGQGDNGVSVPELKQKAIRTSVELAISTYGYSPHHRFGMSDDDPRNIELIYEEMRRLKNDYPELSFFLIETQEGGFVKHEVTLSGPQSDRGAGSGPNDLQRLLFDIEITQKAKKS